MGCYAAFVGIKAANAFCAANPEAKVLVVATELCTLHFQNKTDDDNLISNAISVMDQQRYLSQQILL